MLPRDRWLFHHFNGRNRDHKELNHTGTRNQRVDPTNNTIRIATVNVNGVRAAYRKGMASWIDSVDADIVAVQEVRASRSDLLLLVGDGWHVLNDEATAKGRAGVALLSRAPASASRTVIGADDFDSAGRWLEADYEFGGVPLTVVSAYFHSGEADTPKQIEKYKMLDAATVRLAELNSDGARVVVAGDLNVGHTKLDIKNWRGNVKHAGFLPQERAYFDRFFGAAGAEIEGADGSIGPGLGWVDVGRQFAGEVDGPYTWWSWRGQAFDNGTGWRIDYQMATPTLAAEVTDYRIDRAASYAERWTDHAPVIVDYHLGG